VAEFVPDQESNQPAVECRKALKASASTPMPASCGGRPTTSSPQPQPGITGQITARAEAHTIRLALNYAIADGATHIGRQHVQAALALWDYATRSAAGALQGATGDPLADQIRATLLDNPAGLTRSQISDTLKHNKPAGQIDRALQALAVRRPGHRHEDHNGRRPPRPSLDRRARCCRRRSGTGRARNRLRTVGDRGRRCRGQRGSSTI
jgi:hypothetical protein